MKKLRAVGQREDDARSARDVLDGDAGHRPDADVLVRIDDGAGIGGEHLLGAFQLAHGGEAAGVITAVAADVVHLQVGQRVVVFTRTGAFAK